MFFRQLFVLFAVLITFNVNTAHVVENGDHSTLIFLEEVALGEPCGSCIPSSECRSYIAMPSIKICLPSRNSRENDDENGRILTDEEVVTTPQEMENIEDIPEFQNNPNSPRNTTLEEIGDNNIDTFLTL